MSELRVSQYILMPFVGAALAPSSPALAGSSSVSEVDRALMAMVDERYLSDSREWIEGQRIVESDPRTPYYTHQARQLKFNYVDLFDSYEEQLESRQFEPVPGNIAFDKYLVHMTQKFGVDVYDLVALRSLSSEKQQQALHEINAWHIAHYRRVWIYDTALAIFSDLKSGNTAEAKKAVNKLVKLAQQEEEQGYYGLWHFSYNTYGDDFIDPRGPIGANLWALQAMFALYSCIETSGDRTHLDWLNEKLKNVIFPQQVTDRKRSTFGLIGAGLQNPEKGRDYNASGGYRIYGGRMNEPIPGHFVEHQADFVGMLRLAYRTNASGGAVDRGFLEEIKMRHRAAMQGFDAFWERDHFVSALDAQGRKTVSSLSHQPVVAVDNNTWAGQQWIGYDEERAWQSIQYVRGHFLVTRPYTNKQDKTASFQGLFFFPADFDDAFVDPSPDFEKMIQTEATFGFVLFLADFAKFYEGKTAEPRRIQEALTLAGELYKSMVAFQRHAAQGTGSKGTPYASYNVRDYFNDIPSMAGTASGAIVSESLKNPQPYPELVSTTLTEGALSEFIGINPHRDLTLDAIPEGYVFPHTQFPWTTREGAAAYRAQAGKKAPGRGGVKSGEVRVKQDIDVMVDPSDPFGTSVGTARRGDTYKIVGERDENIQIEIGGKKGWISRHFIEGAASGNFSVSSLKPGDKVDQYESVEGVAPGADGVEIVVLPRGDIEYSQGRLSVGTDGSFSGRAQFGRPQDKGQSFTLIIRAYQGGEMTEELRAENLTRK